MKTRTVLSYEFDTVAELWRNRKTIRELDFIEWRYLKLASQLAITFIVSVAMVLVGVSMGGYVVTLFFDIPVHAFAEIGVSFLFTLPIVIYLLYPWGYFLTHEIGSTED